MTKNDNLPAWVAAIFESLHAVTGSPEPLQWAFDETEQQLIFAPAVAEIQGGANDGAEVYSYYDVDLHSIFMLFDEVPSVSFSTREGECSVEGTIDEDHAWIVFRSLPFADDPPSYKIKDKSWRENDD